MTTDTQQDATEITYGRIDTEAFRFSAEALSLNVRQTDPSPEELEEGEVLVFAKANITGVGLYMAYLSGEGELIVRAIASAPATKLRADRYVIDGPDGSQWKLAFDDEGQPQMQRIA